MARAGLLLVILVALLALPTAAHAQPSTEPPVLLDEIIDVPSEVLPIDISSYDIGYNPDPLPNFDLVLAGMTNFVFIAASWGVALIVWVLDWVFSFGIGRTLGPDAGRLAEVLDLQLFGRLNLVHGGLFTAVAWTGWQLLRNRTARGLTELGVSVLLAGLSGVMLADPVAANCAGVRVLAGLSGEVLAVATETAPLQFAEVEGCSEDAGTQYRAQLAPFGQAITTALVVRPALLLNWGTIPPPDAPGDCRRLAEEALAAGPWGGSNGRRDPLAAVPECYGLTVFNSEPSMHRLAGAVLLLLAVGFAAATTVALAFTIAVAQVIGLLLVTVGPAVLAFGIVPGVGRQLLIRWLTGLARVALAVLTGAALLAFLVVACQSLLDVTRERPLLVSCLLLCAACGAMFTVRRRLIIAGHRFAVAHGERHEDRYGPKWLGFGDPSGDTGFSLHRLGSPGYTHVDALRKHEVVHATFTRNRLAQARAAVGAARETAVGAGLAVATGTVAGVAANALNRPRGRAG